MSARPFTKYNFFYAATAVSLKDKDIKDTEKLRKIAITSMTGKSAASGYGVSLANLVVNAIKQVAEKDNGKYVIDIENIKREKKHGGSSEDTELIKGLVIDKEVVHPGMPKRIDNAKIALLDAALEVKSTETDAKIQITAPNQLQAFLDMEEKMLWVNEKKVSITPHEFNLLKTFMDNVDKPLTRDFLRDEVWGVDGEGVNDNAVNVAINRLKNKIDPENSDTLEYWSFSLKNLGRNKEASEKILKRNKILGLNAPLSVD